ncbi:MAG: adenosylmethionine decarboxylase [Pseudomonadota bacterium]
MDFDGKTRNEPPIFAAGSGGAAQPADHFISVDGAEYAGRHLIIDLHGATKLDDEQVIRQAFLDCIEACGATLLHIHLHRFTPYAGYSGVAVLSESHISIHTWPERDYAALDVFMCGSAEPLKSIDILKAAFEPDRVEVQDILRGGDA